MLSGVTSIREYMIRPEKGGVIALLLLGFLLLSLGVMLFSSHWLAGAVPTLIGCGMIVLGIVYDKRLKPKYAVMLTTAAQEVRTLESRDRAFIARVLAALNQAVIARG